MPSPGVATIKAALVGTTFTVDQTIGDTTESLTCSFTEDAPVVNKLAAGIDSGWTSASPTTISTMAAAISTEFAYLGSAPGVVYLVAIGTTHRYRNHCMGGVMECASGYARVRTTKSRGHGNL